MSIFKNVSSFYHLAEKELASDIMERDQQGFFDKSKFERFAANHLFKGIFNSEPTDFLILRNYYDIVRGSLDLPFASSLAAHGYVSPLLLREFGHEALVKRYQRSIEDGSNMSAISNSEVGTAINLKKITAQMNENGDEINLIFKKPCITNGGSADLLLTTIWNKNELELYLLKKQEVHQSPLSHQLLGFRTGDTGSVEGVKALPDIYDRRVTTGKVTLTALRYCFFIERLIVTVMATGLAHGLEDYLLNNTPQGLQDAGRDNKQYLQEKILRLHMTRVQMTSLVETIINRGPKELMNSDSELSILKIMISTELREAIYNCIEVVGHKSLLANHILSKTLRDVQMCSFFGGTKELQKIGLYSTLMQKRSESALNIIHKKVV